MNKCVGQNLKQGLSPGKLLNAFWLHYFTVIRQVQAFYLFAASLLTCHMTLSKCLQFSEPLFSHLCLPVVFWLFLELYQGLSNTLMFLVGEEQKRTRLVQPDWDFLLDFWYCNFCILSHSNRGFWVHKEKFINHWWDLHFFKMESFSEQVSTIHSLWRQMSVRDQEVAPGTVRLSLDKPCTFPLCLLNFSAFPPYCAPPSRWNSA